MKRVEAFRKQGYVVKTYFDDDGNTTLNVKKRLQEV